MNHEALVARAVRWLRNTKACGVVLAERSGATSFETPDAIGFRFGGGLSILVECKTSRSDFLRDAKKPFRRRPETGMGGYRFFFAMPGVIPVDRLPERWGLLEVRGAIVKVVKPAQVFRAEERSQHREMGLLYAAAQRCQLGVHEEEVFDYGV